MRRTSKKGRRNELYYSLRGLDIFRIHRFLLNFTQPSNANISSWASLIDNNLENRKNDFHGANDLDSYRLNVCNSEKVFDMSPHNRTLFKNIIFKKRQPIRILSVLPNTFQISLINMIKWI